MKGVVLSTCISILCCCVAVAQQYETGLVTNGQPDKTVWHTISLENTYTNPVIIMGPTTEIGPDEAHLRVRNVTSTSFEYQLEEFEYVDGFHSEESFGYLVIEEGVHTIGGLVWEAGTTPGLTDGGLKSVNLASTSFDGSQIVLTQIASDNDPVAAVSRVRLTTNTSFQFKLTEEEAEDNMRSVADDIHYVAVQVGNGTLSDGRSFSAGSTSRVVNDEGADISFTTSVAQPFILAGLQTIIDQDPVVIRYSKLTNQGVTFRLQEEQSFDSNTDHIDEVVGYLVLEGTTAQKQLLWYEDFALADNVVQDNGVTAWTTDATNLGSDGDNYFEVRSGELVAKNTDGEVIWTSEEIAISGYTDVNIAVDIRGEGPMENTDLLKVFYKLDGGPEIPLINGLQRNAFERTTAMIGGISGDQIQIIVKVINSSDSEYYYVDNVRVFTEPNERYAIQDGNWDDPSTWSYTPGGPSCACLPDQLSDTHINGHTVTMTDHGYTHNLTVYNSSTLLWTADDKDLILYGDATLEVKSGGKIDEGATNSTQMLFAQWNARDKDSDADRFSASHPGVVVVITVDDPTGLLVHDMSLDAAGEYIFQGNGNIRLTDDLDVNNEVEITNNLLGEFRIDGNIFLDYANTTLTNNENLVVDNDLLYRRDSIHFINKGDFKTNILRISNDRSNISLTNENNGVFEVKSVTDLGSSELTIDNNAVIKMIGNIVNVEAGEGLFYNHTGGVWEYGGGDYDADLHLFADYEDNEFHYNGIIDQKIITPQDAYWHLTLSNQNTTGTTTSIKTPTTSNLDINGNLTMIGTAEGLMRFDIDGADADISIAGDWWQDEQSGSDPVRYWEGSDNERVIFDGTGDQQIRTDEEFLNIEVDKPSGQVLVENSSRIYEEAIFSEGIVVAQNDLPLVLEENARALQASDASHVVGKVTKKGVADFVFPIGNGTYYRPLGISDLSVASDITAEYIDTTPPNPTIKPDSMINLGPCGYWEVSKSAIGAEAYVTLHWDENNCPVDVDEVIIARWDGARWVSEGRGSITGNAVQGSVTSANKITDFVRFTLAELSDFPVANADTDTTFGRRWPGSRYPP